MYKTIREKWFAIDSKRFHDLNIYSDEDKRKNEETTEKFFRKIEAYIKRKPKNKIEVERWELEGEKIISKFLRENSLMNFGDLDKKIQKDIIKSTKSFIKKAKEFDEDIKGSYISQGLRNIWIINILQLIFDKEAELTSSAFAYSMIYPYTDNFLDDVKISLDIKKEFNDKISSILKGEKVFLEGRLEKRVYRLLKDIENIYDRKSFEGVYKSLLEIHNGQVKSLQQQEGFSIPYEKDILSISIEKGGASVLADGYLVKGTLNVKEKEFCLKYGFLLQLIDDFQDLKSDKEDNHITIFSQLAGKYYLDSIFNKLINYVHYLFDDSELLKSKKDFNKIIKENCLLLILCSFPLNNQYFSQDYVEEMERYLPFRSSYIQKLNKKSMKKIKKLEGII